MHEGPVVQAYLPTIGKIAATLHQSNRSLDRLGNLWEDYVSDLSIEAVLARRQFRDRFGSDAEREGRYVFKSLWNYARRLRARRSKYVGFAAVKPQVIFRIPDPLRTETVVEARAIGKRLKQTLPPKEWSALSATVLEEGDLTEAWRLSGIGNRKWFPTLVRRAVEKAQKTLS